MVCACISSIEAVVSPARVLPRQLFHEGAHLVWDPAAVPTHSDKSPLFKNLTAHRPQASISVSQIPPRAPPLEISLALINFGDQLSKGIEICDLLRVNQTPS